MASNLNPNPTEWDKQHWKEAERAHDLQMRHYELHAKQVELFAGQTLRTISLAAAGGIAAALGFYSANFSRLQGMPSALDGFNKTLVALFVALLLSMASAGFAYFSQIAFAEVINSREHHYEHPYVRDTKATPVYNFVGGACRWIAIIFAIGGICALIYAGLLFASLVH